MVLLMCFCLFPHQKIQMYLLRTVNEIPPLHMQCSKKTPTYCTMKILSPTTHLKMPQETLDLSVPRWCQSHTLQASAVASHHRLRMDTSRYPSTSRGERNRRRSTCPRSSRSRASSLLAVSVQYTRRALGPIHATRRFIIAVFGSLTFTFP